MDSLFILHHSFSSHFSSRVPDCSLEQCIHRLNSLRDQCPTWQTAASDVSAKLFCMWKNFLTQRSNFTQFVLQRRGNPSASRSPVAFCLVVYTAERGSRSLCCSANQPVIPVLLMWEVMLHATLSFSHQCSLCLCLYLFLYISFWGTVASLWLGHCSDSLAEPACWACLHGFMLLGCWLMQHLCSFNCLLFQPRAERNE